MKSRYSGSGNVVARLERSELAARTFGPELQENLCPAVVGVETVQDRTCLAFL